MKIVTLFFQIVIAIPYIGGFLFLMPVYLAKYGFTVKAIGMSFAASILGYPWTVWFFIPIWLLIWLVTSKKKCVLHGKKRLLEIPVLLSIGFVWIGMHFAHSLFLKYDESIPITIAGIGGFVYGIYLSKKTNAS